MDADDGKLPRFSYDLVTWLDESIARPEFPRTAKGFGDLSELRMRAAAFTGGARSIVDMLLDIRSEEEVDEETEEESDGVSDETDAIFPRVFEAGSLLREITPPLRVANDGTRQKLDD